MIFFSKAKKYFADAISIARVLKIDAINAVKELKHFSVHFGSLSTMTIITYKIETLDLKNDEDLDDTDEYGKDKEEKTHK